MVFMNCRFLIPSYSFESGSPRATSNAVLVPKCHVIPIVSPCPSVRLYHKAAHFISPCLLHFPAPRLQSAFSRRTSGALPGNLQRQIHCVRLAGCQSVPCNINLPCFRSDLRPYINLTEVWAPTLLWNARTVVPDTTRWHFRRLFIIFLHRAF